MLHLNKKKKMSLPLREALVDPSLKWIDFCSWKRGILPKKKDTWFVRDDETLSREVLPTKGGGVYEIALSKDKGVTMVVVYVGIATKVNKQAKGTTLRKRIYSTYCKNGSHLSGNLTPYLEEGWEVYFRWCFFPKVTVCREYETLALKKWDYAFNEAGNQGCPKRFPVPTYTPHEKIIALFKSLPSGQQLATLSELVKIFRE